MSYTESSSDECGWDIEIDPDLPPCKPSSSTRYVLEAVTHRRIMEYIGWTATVISITGVVLNNYRSKWCFALWLVSNALCFVIHYRKRMVALTVRDLVFLGLAVHGLIMWSK